MQPTQSILRILNAQDRPRRTQRVRQADRFEILTAASEAEDICPDWIADRLSEPERVSP